MKIEGGADIVRQTAMNKWSGGNLNLNGSLFVISDLYCLFYGHMTMTEEPWEREVVKERWRKYYPKKLALIDDALSKKSKGYWLVGRLVGFPTCQPLLDYLMPKSAY